MPEKDLISNENINLNYKDLFEAIMDHTNNYIYFKDTKSRFIYVSNYQMQTFISEDIIGKTDFDFYPKELAQEFFDDEQRIIKTQKPMLNKEEKLTFLNGKTTWTIVSKFPLYDHSGKLIGIWGLSLDISDQKKVEFQLAEVNEKLEEARKFYQDQSETDKMTNLFNQRKFFEEAEAAYERTFSFQRKEENFCIAFIDVDNFKYANDNHGHQFGDFVLKEIADIIKNTIRTYDVAFRYGGDEFLILYKSCTIAEAKDIAERIRQKVEAATFSNNDHTFKTTVSIGISCADEKPDVDSLIKLADKRLYTAKKAGRNTVL